jgi:hypothetical protein
LVYISFHLQCHKVFLAKENIPNNAQLQSVKKYIKSKKIKLPFTVRLSGARLRNIKQNIWFSNGINFITMLLIVPGFASLLFVALADILAALIFIFNSMRLLRINPMK